MATVKKKTPAKKTAVKKAPAKAPVVKKAPVKKKTTTTKRATAKKSPEMRSFRVASDQQAFTEFKITRQTVYWIILIAFIIFAQLWILKLQIEVATLIDAQQAQLRNL